MVTGDAWRRRRSRRWSRWGPRRGVGVVYLGGGPGWWCQGAQVWPMGADHRVFILGGGWTVRALSADGQAGGKGASGGVAWPAGSGRLPWPAGWPLSETSHPGCPCRLPTGSRGDGRTDPTRRNPPPPARPHDKAAAGVGQANRETSITGAAETRHHAETSIQSWAAPNGQGGGNHSLHTRLPRSSARPRTLRRDAARLGSSMRDARSVRATRTRQDLAPRRDLAARRYLAPP